MQKLSISFKHCYGITELSHTFDFSNKNTVIIYAPNGAMKTSFAKTFKDLSIGAASKDEIFTDRITERIIKDESGNDLDPNEIFVIEPYNQEFSGTEKISTLLATKDIKEKYDQLHKELDIQKANFITKLKGISSSTDCESELMSTFVDESIVDFWTLIVSIEPELNTKYHKYEFRYNDVFDPKNKVRDFIEKHKDSLEDYITKYDDLISTSDFFNKSLNTFGTYQAQEIGKSIKDDSFFQAGHKLGLKNGKTVSSKKEYDEIFDTEISRVVNDPALKKIFSSIEKSLNANSELRTFKTVVEQDNLLLLKIKNFEQFKKEVWYGYLGELKTEISELISNYHKNKNEIDKILETARAQTTEWENSIREFNDRFINMPFKLKLKNREDVILKTESPNIELLFKEDISGLEKAVPKEELLHVLSQGERRALYLLNIIFEIQARRKTNQKTLFIIDDIADSFDYKNKYAIIEYLREMSEIPFFYQIIMTHNFDFFRSVHGRIITNSYMQNSMVVIRGNNIRIESIAYKGLINPFQNWKQNVNKQLELETNLEIKAYLIALIPFIRNLIEYSHGTKSEQYMLLTHLLHIKEANTENPELLGTNDISYNDIIDIYKIYIPKISIDSGEEKIIDDVFNIASEIVKENSHPLDIKTKVIISMAIRLKTELFLLRRLESFKELLKFKSNQTVELIKTFKEKFVNEKDVINVMDQVNLITPENIHLNSFMYEPILDMGDDHLKCLYQKVENLWDRE